MNIIDLIFIAILGLSLVAGMRRGFLASVLLTLGFFGAWVAANALYPQLVAIIESNTNLTGSILYYIDTSSLFSTAGLANMNIADALANEHAQLEQAIVELGNAHVPSLILESFKANVQGNAFANVPNMTTLSQYLNQTLLDSVVNVLSFVAIFAVGYMVVSFLVNLLDHVIQFPLLRHFDWLLGGVFGLVRGGVIIAVLCSILPTALSAISLDVIQEMVNTSKFVSMFKDVGFLNSLIGNTRL